MACTPHKCTGGGQEKEDESWLGGTSKNWGGESGRHLQEGDTGGGAEINKSKRKEAVFLERREEGTKKKQNTKESERL